MSLLWTSPERKYNYEIAYNTYNNGKWLLIIGDFDYWIEKEFPARPTKKQIRAFKNLFFRKHTGCY